MLKDGVLQPERLVDIARLPLRGITRDGDMLRVGALATMEELAADATVAERLPFVREALLAGASPQLRNMATIGGNILQRTRCRYFRDPAVASCNKRVPGSGCAAVGGAARMHAILGASEHCIALHASDLCVPLVALNAVAHIQGAGAQRSVPLTEFYVLPRRSPGRRERARARRAGHRDRDAAAAGGHPVGLPEGSRSRLLRVRADLRRRRPGDRGGVITRARVALGGVGTIPWRGRRPKRCCAAHRSSPDVPGGGRRGDPRPVHGPGTAFKVELAKRTLVRILQTVAGGGSS